jgi:glycosyltransferase involved in cell wall biosynthesis
MNFIKISCLVIGINQLHSRTIKTNKTDWTSGKLKIFTECVSSIFLRGFVMKNGNNGKQVTITALVFTLNEEQNLPYILPDIPDWIDEILLIDGHSTDNTVQVAKELCPRIRIAYQPGRGKGDAMKFGFKQAKGDILITLDADGATDPKEIEKFVEPLLKGYDFAKGTRLLVRSEWGGRWHRFVANKSFVYLTNLLYGSEFTDLCAGYNAFWKTAIEKIQFSDNGYENEPLMYIRATKAGLKIIEVPFRDNGRFYGYTKEPAIRAGWTTIKTIFKEKFN